MSLVTKKWIIQSAIKKAYYKKAYPNVNICPSVVFRDKFIVLPTDSAKIDIGDRTFFNNYCSITAHSEVIIGTDCLFGENVKIYDHNHIFNDATRPIREQGFKVKPIYIGDNVWIGSNVLILAGSRIGNHCVIAGGVTVNFEVPDNHIVKRDGTIERIKEA